MSVSDGDSTEDNTLYRNLIVSVQNANESAPVFEVSVENFGTNRTSRKPAVSYDSSGK